MLGNRLLLILFLIVLLPDAFAETPEEKGLAIAIESDKRDTGWVDQSADLEMILRNKQGDTSTRTHWLLSIGCLAWRILSRQLIAACGLPCSISFSIAMTRSPSAW